ncbi:MAG TPA: thiolase domain-containing protein, partial [Candidatus Binatia bacterium]|nr:thiolase domain-containing protein [Candidatus Binatia bacterium]
MSIKGKAYIAGVYEHPGRELPDTSLAQIHAEVAVGALEDAGLSLADVDGYLCAGDAPGFGGLSMADYLGLKLSYIDSTETGGSSYVVHVGHAAAAIAEGKCSVALITLAGKPRSGGNRPGGSGRPEAPESSFETIYGTTVVSMYALAARRHMYEYGTTSEDLAEIKVAASQHAQHNPHALLRDVVTVEEVVNSPMIADPLHRLDCCIITDGGGALVIVSPGVASDLRRTKVKILGHGEAPKHTDGG